MDHPGRDSALERLEPLVGSWTVEAIFPSMGPTGVAGRTTFEWALDGRYLLQRAEVDHPDAPNALTVIAPAADGDGFTQHYFDSRGVVRLYAMTFAGGEWTLRRTAPDFSPLGFSQRFSARVSADGDAIAGAWETSNDGGAVWEHDFELVYRRIA
jgi:hypothetical protein